jgi:hypothetical protein
VHTRQALTTEPHFCVLSESLPSLSMCGFFVVVGFFCLETWSPYVAEADLPETHDPPSSASHRMLGLQVSDARSGSA